jgi:hypothetical protein
VICTCLPPEIIASLPNVTNLGYRKIIGTLALPDDATLAAEIDSVNLRDLSTSPATVFF